MDRTTKRVMELVASDAYLDSVKAADALMEKVARSNRFQVDAARNEAESFFSKMRNEEPEIYQMLLVREKEVQQVALRIKTGKGIILD